MEETFSCLLLTYSSYDPWQCTQAGLWLIVTLSMKETEFENPIRHCVYLTVEPRREDLTTCKDES